MRGSKGIGRGGGVGVPEHSFEKSKLILKIFFINVEYKQNKIISRTPTAKNLLIRACFDMED